MPISRSKKIKIRAALLSIMVGAIASYYVLRPPTGDIDLLIYHLERSGSMFDRIYATGWSHSPQFLRNLLRRPVPPEEDHQISAFYLGRMGSSAARAIPILSRVALKDGDISLRREAAGALVAIAPQSQETLRVLVSHLKDPDPILRHNAARLFSVLGQKHPPAVEPLVRWLEGPPDPASQTLTGLPLRPKELEIIASLAVVGPEDPRTILALTRFLEGEKLNSRTDWAVSIALQSLGKGGRAAEGAIPVMKRLLAGETSSSQEPVEIVSRATAKFSARTMRDCGEAIFKIEPRQAPFVVMNLTKYTDQVDLNELFARMAPFAGETVPELKKELATAGDARRPSLAEVFWRMAPHENQFILAQLREGLRSTNLLARGNSAFVIWEITGEPSEPVKAILESLDDSSGSDLIHLLARMGPAAGAALPSLRIIAVSNRFQFVRMSAEAAISRIEGAPSKTK